MTFREKQYFKVHCLDTKDAISTLKKSVTN